MKQHTIAKFMIALVLTLALTVGLGIVGEQVGLSIVQPAYACNTHNGGGC